LHDLEESIENAQYSGLKLQSSQNIHHQRLEPA